MKAIITAILLAFAVGLQAQQSEPAVAAVTNSPIVLKGIYASRSRYASQTNQYYTTEAAVMRCLRWFKKTQSSDGSWGDATDPKPLATAVALQTFLKHGESPASEEFGSTVERGLKFLLSAEGSKQLPEGQPAAAIEHGICAWTLCEAYAMTRIPSILPAATNAISTVLAAQRASGLWHTAYEREQGNDDLEASVWQMLALKSALFAGVADDSVRPALKKGAEGMKKLIQEDGKSRARGPAVLSLQIAGLGRDPSSKAGLASLDGLTMNWENPEFGDPVYNWYFITQAMFHQGGQAWSAWNKSFAPTLVKRQSIQAEAVEGSQKDKKADIGHWLSPGTNERFGKVYATALCCMMLENYYAWLPTYRPEPKEIAPEEDKEIQIDVK